ncbi:MAG: PTS sugar transporter subunit IIA [Candidatus Omnitrophica bacterium]|nr:PTS sugar transporter subunit IIA [Candidatus Omnitrophota bacterium]
MLVSQYLKEKFCILELGSDTKEGAVREIADKLESTNKITNKEKFIDDVLEREHLGSTGIGNSIGIPHARTDSVKGFVMGFGRSSKGIEFKALDGVRVKLIFLMGADPGELNLYLRILAELSKLLMDQSFRDALLSASSEAEIIKILKKFDK